MRKGKNLSNQKNQNDFYTNYGFVGAEQLQNEIENLSLYRANLTKLGISDISLTNYLWVVKPGVNISTFVTSFTNSLSQMKIMRFTGKERFFSHYLPRLGRDNLNRELNLISESMSHCAGHNRFFRGIAFINIDEWMHKTNDKLFLDFLDFCHSHNERVMFILFTEICESEAIANAEKSIASHQLRFKTIKFNHPDADFFVEYIVHKFFTDKSLKLSDDARLLLKASIEYISESKNFRGFTTINMLAADIRQSILTNTISGNTITIEMLSDFDVDSKYIQNFKTLSELKDTSIGFKSSTQEGTL
jgi:hypothetical protein